VTTDIVEAPRQNTIASVGGVEVLTTLTVVNVISGLRLAGLWAATLVGSSVECV
jgi:hypothetical protein